MALPERLVVLATFGQPELAREALRVLRDAGIHAEAGSGFTKGRSERVVRVFEADVERASTLIAPLVRDDQEEHALVCPRCGGRRVAARPAVALYTIVAGVALALVLAKLGQSWSVMIVLIATFVAAALLEKKVGRWRCETCRHIWGGLSGRDRPWVGPPL